MTRSKVTKITPALFDEILKQDFRAFIHRVVQQLSSGTPYQPNWHIDAAAYQLERVRRGELTRLIINMPPRSLKSIVTSVAFPAFLLGHNPGMRIICVSYGADLAAKHARDFREIINSPWYRRLFPKTRISPAKNTEAEITTTAGGSTVDLDRGHPDRPRRRPPHHRRPAQTDRRSFGQQTGTRQ